MAKAYAANESLADREYVEEEHPLRTPFQRDRDRIIHSQAFRRLEYKTQVFVNSLGDHYRTRLTHSLEVSQIARTIARSLGLNEDLTEALSLAHDLGHPPFGHAGEKALSKMLKEHGGFDHNQQTLRIVEKLERRYSEFPGLNLTKAMRLGLRKHEKYPDNMAHTLEAQLVDLCDEIAYNTHDLEDGLESGFLRTEDLSHLELWQTVWDEILHRLKGVELKIKIRTAIRKLIDTMVRDTIETSLQNLEKNKIQTLEDVLAYRADDDLISPSTSMKQNMAKMKKFLFKNLYRHPQVVRMNIRAEQIIFRLFNFLIQDTSALPESYQKTLEEEGSYIAVKDYIAGMTDRYAMQWNRDILGVEEW
ncbi:MAG: deoxyguanosinetriphosphate triphosphohydrolase [Candidatus Hydrogenedentota bacterium]|nr:MAG: deoxyguanosinetriphosphate triphosphohydrolase [Candidatus Hydrogenedentota bacterium]